MKYIYVAMDKAKAEQNQNKPVEMAIQIADEPDLYTAMLNYLLEFIKVPETDVDAILDEALFSITGMSALIRNPTEKLAGIFVFEDMIDLQNNQDKLISELARLYPEDFQVPPLAH